MYFSYFECVEVVPHGKDNMEVFRLVSPLNSHDQIRICAPCSFAYARRNAYAYIESCCVVHLITGFSLMQSGIKKIGIKLRSLTQRCTKACASTHEPKTPKGVTGPVVVRAILAITTSKTPKRSNDAPC